MSARTAVRQGPRLASYDYLVYLDYNTINGSNIHPPPPLLLTSIAQLWLGNVRLPLIKVGNSSSKLQIFFVGNY